MERFYLQVIEPIGWMKRLPTRCTATLPMITYAREHNLWLVEERNRP